MKKKEVKIQKNSGGSGVYRWVVIKMLSYFLFVIITNIKDEIKMQ